MKKIYITPILTIHVVHGKTNVLQTNTNVCSVNSQQVDWESNERVGSDLNLVGSPDGSTGTGGFGTDNDPWESIW